MCIDLTDITQVLQKTINLLEQEMKARRYIPHIKMLTLIVHFYVNAFCLQMTIPVGTKFCWDRLLLRDSRKSSLNSLQI